MPYKRRPNRDPNKPPLKTKPRRCGIYHKDTKRRCDKPVDVWGKHFGPHHDMKWYNGPKDAWEDIDNYPIQPPTPDRWYWV